MKQTIEADLTWTGSRFESGIQIRVRADGRIDAVGRLEEVPTLRLPGEALLPGFVNVHSHAVLRALRGRTEHRDRGATQPIRWRDEVGALASRLEPHQIHDEARRTFLEMRDSGITTVGEFYERGRWAADSDAGARAIIEAARDTGIRLVLLQAPSPCEGDSGEPPDRFWDAVEGLESEVTARQSLGIALDDVLSSSMDAVDELYTSATSRGMVFHAHLEQSRFEIEEVRRITGKSPLTLINERMEIMANFTAVHCTHSDPRELDRFLDRGANLCVTPLTDAHLGRGIQRRLPLWVSRLCIGTGTNLRIGMLEELRWLEYTHRLDGRTRDVFREGAGTAARALLGMATAHGGQAMGTITGRIEPGYAADFVTVDLTATQLADTGENHLLESLLFGCDESVVRRTAVDGDWTESGRPGSVRDSLSHSRTG